MKHKNEKGFTLILSLVLLLVMSLMGGGLVVVSSSDHQSNNSSDEYQQAFYIAEHALLEAEKSLINKMMGPMLDTNPPSRNEDIRSIPTNVSDDISNLDQTTPCYRSFRNLSRADDFEVVEHIQDVNFFDVIEPIFATSPDFGTPVEIERERARMERFRYEYFSVNAGSSTYKSSGMSLKKTSTTTQRQGTAYRIYACGILGNTSNPEILIPLETIAIISHWTVLLINFI